MGPPRALPGEKEKPCGRSARAHSPPPLRRTAGGEAGPGRAPSGGGPGGGGGGICSTPEPGSEGDPESRLESSRRGPRSWSGGRGCPRPRASTIVWASGSPLAPPPRLSAPHPTRLPPGEKAGGGGKACLGWLGVRGPEVGGGRRGREVCAGWGRGQVTADGGGKAREDRWGRKWGGSPGGGKGCSGWGAASEARTWPSPGTLLPGSRRRTDFFAHSLSHALNSLTKLPAVAAPRSPFPPLHSPRLPAPFLPLLLSLPPQVSGEITAGLLSIARKSRERSGSSAWPAREVGVGGRWGTVELLVAMTTAKPWIPVSCREPRQ